MVIGPGAPADPADTGPPVPPDPDDAPEPPGAELPAPEPPGRDAETGKVPFALPPPADPRRDPSGPLQAASRLSDATASTSAT